MIAILLIISYCFHMDDNEKRTMTLNLTPREMAVLEELAIKKDLSKTGVMKLALRLLQAVDAKIRLGNKLMVEDEKTKEKSELVLL
jgi:hypothetical protein